MTDNEKLIEEAAKAIWDADSAVPEAWDNKNVVEWDRNTYREMARAALAVFEKAHAPTDDERIVRASIHGDVDAIRALGRLLRRPEAPAPVFPDQSIAEAVEIMREAETHRTTRPEQQGEPSDAQVQRFIRNLWPLTGDRISMDRHDPWTAGRIRDALRAAGGVR